MAEAKQVDRGKRRVVLGGAVCVALALALMVWWSLQCEPPAPVVADKPTSESPIAERSDSLLREAAPGVVGGPEPAPTAKTDPAALLEATGRAVIHVVDPNGLPLSRAEVWLAQNWLTAAQLRAMPGAPHGVTGEDGAVIVEAPRATYRVHVFHKDYVCTVDSHGNGAKATIELVDRCETTLRMCDVWIVAFEFSKVGEVAAHADHGSLAVLHRSYCPSTMAELADIEARLRASHPDASITAYENPVNSPYVGEWRVHVCWAGRTPVDVPLKPVPMRDFVAPTMIGFGDSLPSGEFGTVLLEGEIGFEVGAQPVQRGPVQPGTSWMYWPMMIHRIKPNKLRTLPVGSYNLMSDKFPLLTADLARGGPLVVTAGSHETRHIEFRNGLRAVRIDLEFPSGYRHRGYSGILRCIATNSMDLLMGIDETQWCERQLPAGDYELRLSMETHDSGIRLQTSPLFRVEPGSAVQVVKAILLPTAAPLPVPLKFPTGSSR